MKNKFLILKIFCAAMLSLIAIPALLISLFAFPIELIAFDPARYYPVLEQDIYKEEFPVLVSELLSNQLFNWKVNPTAENFAYQEKMSAVLVDYLPQDWLDEVAGDVIDKAVAYFNFKTPYDTIEVDISKLINSISQNSESIGEEYLSSLKYCTVEQDNVYSQSEKIFLTALTICNPSASNKDKVLNAMDVFIQDRVNQLPGSINVFGIIPAKLMSGERFFYFYSIARWIFRLLPFFTIILLILIAQLLKTNKKIMRKWSGLLLTFIPAVVMVGLIIILIGLDQFIGLIFKKYFSQVMAGFGQVLLWILQDIGGQVLLWTAAGAGAVFLFGLVLLLFAKFTKDEIVETSHVTQIESGQSSAAMEKEIVPETLDEVEKREEKLNNLENE